MGFIREIDGYTKAPPVNNPGWPKRAREWCTSAARVSDVYRIPFKTIISRGKERKRKDFAEVPLWVIKKYMLWTPAKID